MKIEQTREILEKIKIANSVNARPIITNKELQESLNTAIKSLNMWDKVIKEMYYYTPIEKIEIIGFKKALDIIKKYKQEIEE